MVLLGVGDGRGKCCGGVRMGKGTLESVSSGLSPRDVGDVRVSGDGAVGLRDSSLAIISGVRVGVTKGAGLRSASRTELEVFVRVG